MSEAAEDPKAVQVGKGELENDQIHERVLRAFQTFEPTLLPVHPVPFQRKVLGQASCVLLILLDDEDVTHISCMNSDMVTPRPSGWKIQIAGAAKTSRTTAWPAGAAPIRRMGGAEWGTISWGSLFSVRPEDVDDFPIRLALTELLEADGHDVRAVENAPAALAALETAPTDLVLSDLGCWPWTASNS